MLEAIPKVVLDVFLYNVLDFHLEFFLEVVHDIVLKIVLIDFQKYFLHVGLDVFRDFVLDGVPDAEGVVDDLIFVLW